MPATMRARSVRQVTLKPTAKRQAAGAVPKPAGKCALAKDWMMARHSELLASNGRELTPAMIGNYDNPANRVVFRSTASPDEVAFLALVDQDGEAIYSTFLPSDVSWITMAEESPLKSDALIIGNRNAIEQLETALERVYAETESFWAAVG